MTIDTRLTSAPADRPSLAPFRAGSPGVAPLQRPEAGPAPADRMDAKPFREPLPGELQEAIEDIYRPGDQRQARELLSRALRDRKQPQLRSQVAEALAERMRESELWEDPAEELLLESMNQNPRAKELLLSEPPSPGFRKGVQAYLSHTVKGDAKSRQKMLDNLWLLMHDDRVPSRQAVYDLIAQNIAKNDGSVDSQALLRLLSERSKTDPAAAKAWYQARIGQAGMDARKPIGREWSAARDFLYAQAKSEDPEIRRMAVDALEQSVRNGGASANLTDLRTVEANDALARLISDPKHGRSAAHELAYQRPNSGGLEAIVRRFAKAENPAERQALAEALLSSYATREAIGKGKLPGGAEVLGKALAEGPEFDHKHKALFILRDAKSEEARRALLEAAKHAKSGHVAGELLLSDPAGRALVKQNWDELSPEQKRNTARVLFHPENAKDPEVRKVIEAALKSDDPAMKSTALRMLAYHAHEWVDDPDKAREYADLAVEALRGSGKEDRENAAQMLRDLVKHNRWDEATKSELYGKIRVRAEELNDYSLNEAANALCPSGRGYMMDQRYFEKNLMSGDPKDVSYALGFPTKENMLRLQARLSAMQPPRTLESLFDGLREKDPKRYEEILSTLLRNSVSFDGTDPFGRIVVDQLKKDPQAARELASRALGQGWETWSEPSKSAAEALAAAGRLEELKAHSQGKLGKAGNDGIAKLLGDEKLAPAAAEALLSADRSLLSEEAREALTAYAVRHPELKARALQKLDSTPMPNEKIEELGRVYQEMLQDEIKGGWTPQMKALQGLLRAKHWHEKDPDLRGNIDVGKVNADYAALLKDKEMLRQMEQIRQRAIQRVLGDNPGKQLKEHLLSKDFQNRLKLLPEAEAKALVQSEMIKLKLVDPQGFESFHDEFVGRTAEARGLELYRAGDPEKTSKAIRDAFNEELQGKGTAGVGESSKIGGDAAKAGHELTAAISERQAKLIDKALRAVPQGASPDQAADFVVKFLQKVQPGETAAEAAERLKAAGVAARMQKNNRFGRIMLAAGLLANGASILDKPEEAAKATGGFLSLASNIKELGHYFKLESKLGELTKFGKLARAAEFLGPVGDAITVGFDIQQLGKEIESGDTVGAISTGVGIAAGTASFAAGVLILAGASGPGAPFVLAAGTIVGLAAWAFNELFGESEEESFLKRGVHLPGHAHPSNYWVD